MKCKINIDSELGILYQYIKENYKKKGNKILELDHVNAALFKNKKRKNLSNLMSTLTGHFKDYFIHMRLHKTKLLQNALLIEELNNRLLYDETEQVYLDTLKNEDKWPLGIMNGIYKQMIFHQLYFSYNPIKNSDEGHDLLNLNIRSNQFSFAAMASLHQLELITRKQLKRKDENIEEAIGYKGNEIRELIDSLSAIHLRADRSEFKKVLDHYYNNWNNWDENLQNLTFQILRKQLRNGIITGYNTIGEYVSFTKFRWYQAENQLIELCETSFAITTYECAVMSGEFDFAQDIFTILIKSKKNDYEGNDIRLFKGMLCFAQGKYAEAHDNITELNKLGRVEKLTARTWQMMCYAELLPTDTNFLHAQYVNYKAFLNRYKNQYSDFIMECNHNFAQLWKTIFLDKNVKGARSILDQNIPISKRYFFLKKM
ncbi:MAG: hypothetical protein V3V00_02200 [Saprospiraceae bacterium]